MQEESADTGSSGEVRVRIHCAALFSGPARLPFVLLRYNACKRKRETDEGDEKRRKRAEAAIRELAAGKRVIRAYITLQAATGPYKAV